MTDAQKVLWKLSWRNLCKLKKTILEKSLLPEFVKLFKFFSQFTLILLKGYFTVKFFKNRIFLFFILWKHIVLRIFSEGVLHTGRKCSFSFKNVQSLNFGPIFHFFLILKCIKFWRVSLSEILPPLFVYQSFFHSKNGKSGIFYITIFYALITA